MESTASHWDGARDPRGLCRFVLAGDDGFRA